MGCVSPWCSGLPQIKSHSPRAARGCFGAMCSGPWFYVWAIVFHCVQFGPCQLQVGPCQEHLPATKRQERGHLSSASVRLSSLLEPQHPLRTAGWREVLCAPGKLVGQDFRWLHVSRNRFYMSSILASPHI